MARTRASRALIGLLCIVILIGLIAYFHNTSKTSAEVAEKKTDSAQALAASPVSAPAVTTTPKAPEIALAQNAPAPVSASTQPAAWNAPATAPAVSNNPVADATATLEQGNLLKAREILNDALVSGQLKPDDTTAVKQKLQEVNQQVFFSSRKFPDDKFGGTYTVQPGQTLQKIANELEVTWELLARLNQLSDPRKLRAAQTIKIAKGPFNAVVDKSEFTMDIWIGPPREKGGLYLMTLPVGLGADDSTPTGVWLVEPQKKIKNPTYFSPRGEGVIDADDPKNPLGERWVGLTGIDGHAVGKLSYGIHGTIEPDSIGKMMSMGCIRLRNEDVELVYDLMVEGKSTVIVQD